MHVTFVTHVLNSAMDLLMVEPGLGLGLVWSGHGHGLLDAA